MNVFQSKYKVLQKIGEGSFSEVLKCENRKTGICYAAKRLKKTYKTENSITNCAEIIAAKKVPPHIHLLNMLEYHYDNFTGQVTFLFELMDMSMYDYLQTKRRGLSEHRARNYLYQILSGLEHLHDNGLFHRDVKPENILIKFPSILYTPISETSAIEIVKLADLGSVRGIFSEPPYTEYISTRWYRSPECLLTVGNYGPKMDVWAAGCVFYEMLTLKPLFPGNDEIDQLFKIHKILGAPSIQYLSKLKSKSRNCIYFPKIKGSGVDILLPIATRSGKHILRQMLEYDSDKRITVKRILKNSYFDEARHHSRKLVKMENSKNRGDDGTLPTIYPMVGKYFKLESYSDGSKKSNESTPNKYKLKKREMKIGDTKKDSGGSVKSCKSYKSKTLSNLYSSTFPCVEPLPIVGYQVHKTLNKRSIPDDYTIKNILKKDPLKSAKKSKSVENKKKSGPNMKLYSKSCVYAK